MLQSQAIKCTYMYMYMLLFGGGNFGLVVAGATRPAVPHQRKATSKLWMKHCVFALDCFYMLPLHTVSIAMHITVRAWS